MDACYFLSSTNEFASALTSIDAVYVDEHACIGCTLCAGAAPATFFMEEWFGRARVYQQQGDAAPVIQSAIELCPVGLWAAHRNTPLGPAYQLACRPALPFSFLPSSMVPAYICTVAGVVHPLRAAGEAGSARSAAAHAKDQPVQPPRRHGRRGAPRRHSALDRSQPLGARRREGWRAHQRFFFSGVRAFTHPRVASKL